MKKILQILYTRRKFFKYFKKSTGEVVVDIYISIYIYIYIYVEAPTRLRVLQKIRHHLVINLCRVLYQVAGNIVSLISTVQLFTSLDIGDPEFPSSKTTNSSRRRHWRPALRLPLARLNFLLSGPRTPPPCSGWLRGNSPFATSPTPSRGTTTYWRRSQSTPSAQ